MPKQQGAGGKMSEWQETVVVPQPPSWHAVAESKHGRVTVKDSGDPAGHFAPDCRYSAHAHWSFCWTTQAHAKKIGEMALRHLRELEAEVAAMDSLPANARVVEADHV